MALERVLAVVHIKYPVTRSTSHRSTTVSDFLKTVLLRQAMKEPDNIQLFSHYLVLFLLSFQIHFFILSWCVSVNICLVVSTELFPMQTMYIIIGFHKYTPGICHLPLDCLPIGNLVKKGMFLHTCLFMFT